MQPAPLVTCVIPTRARPTLLRRALGSVVHQTYPNIEIVLVVSPPHEPVRRILEEYNTTDAPTIRPFFTGDPPDGSVGANVARNRGIQEASGEFVAFLDDDDVWKPGKLHQQMPYLQYLDSFSIVGCGLTWVDTPEAFDITLSDEVLYEIDVDTAFYHYAALVPSCVVCRRSELRAIGGFDEEIRWGEMWDVSLKIMDRFRPGYMLDDHLMIHDRRHDRERMSDHGGTENLDQAMTVFHRHADKVNPRIARRTWVRLKYGYYRELRNLERYYHLLAGLRKDYEGAILRNEAKRTIERIGSHFET